MRIAAPQGLLDRLDRAWARVEHRTPVVFAVRCVTLFLRTDARDRVLMLAGQGFIALIPMLVVIASFTSASGAGSVGDRIIDKMSLTGSAAEGVQILFEYPPGATGGVTLFSCVLLLFSLNGFTKSTQRTFEGAWGLPRVGIRGTANRAAGFVVLICCGAATGWLSGVLHSPPVVVVGIVVQVSVLTAGWLVATDLMLSRRIPQRRLMLGALFSAVVQLLVTWGTSIYLPELFERNAQRYGVIGVALTLVTWLIAVAAVIVAAAIVGAVLGAWRTPGGAAEEAD
jgi:uncharacterized BrkB/YihY/UPF0761 family membrane protein